jgi:hypothetical protein
MCDIVRDCGRVELVQKTDSTPLDSADCPYETDKKQRIDVDEKFRLHVSRVTVKVTWYRNIDLPLATVRDMTWKRKKKSNCDEHAWF